MLFTTLFAIVFIAICFFVAPVTVTPDSTVDYDCVTDSECELGIPTWDEIWEQYEATLSEERQWAVCMVDSYTSTLPSESQCVTSDQIAAAAEALMALPVRFIPDESGWSCGASLEDGLLVGQYWVDLGCQVVLDNGRSWVAA